MVIQVAAWRKGCRINPYVLIVYDDCIDVATKYNQDFLDMFYLGRHKKVGAIWAGQHFYAAAKGGYDLGSA